MGWVSKNLLHDFLDAGYIVVSAIFSFDDVTIIKILYVCVNYDTIKYLAGYLGFTFTKGTTRDFAKNRENSH